MRFIFAIVLVFVASPLAAQAPTPFDTPNNSGRFRVGLRPFGQPATLTVQGNGTVMVAPDEMRLDVSVSTRGIDLADVSQRHAETAAKALDALHALQKERAGLSIESSGFELSREIPPSDPAHKTPAPNYVANTMFHLKSTLAGGANDLVGRLAAIGLFEIGASSYGLSDERMARDQARRAAVADAREKATVYSEAADVKLLDIATINDEEQPPLPRLMRAIAVASSAPMSIVPPAEIAITARVGIVWHIGPRS